MSTDPRHPAGQEPAHDVLAAEEFAVPTSDPELRPVQLPEDPSGIAAPHDVLAAEEFAMPAGRAAQAPGPGAPRAVAARWAGRAALAVAVLALLRALWRRR